MKIKSVVWEVPFGEVQESKDLTVQQLLRKIQTLTSELGSVTIYDLEIEENHDDDKIP